MLEAKNQGTSRKPEPRKLKDFNCELCGWQGLLFLLEAQGWIRPVNHRIDVSAEAYGGLRNLQGSQEGPYWRRSQTPLRRTRWHSILLARVESAEADKCISEAMKVNLTASAVCGYNDVIRALAIQDTKWLPRRKGFREKTRHFHQGGAPSVPIT